MTTLAAYFHDLNPVILRISGEFAVRWYGVGYLAGFGVGYMILVLLSRLGWLRIPRERIVDALMWMVGGVILGGRLGYMVVYDPKLFVTFTYAIPFWGGFQINNGGMASHGGLIGVIVAAWRISRGWENPDGTVTGRCSIWHVFDAMALGCTPGLFFGRLANFVNGELLGRVYSAAPIDGGAEGPWWTVQFPTELSERLVDLSAAQKAWLSNVALSLGPKVQLKEAAGYVARHAAEMKDQLRPILSSRHPSQLYQAAAEGLAVAAVVWLVWWLRPRAAGLIGCIFMITYGLLRVLTEFWRLPDAQFGASARIYGLSRGQWLSVAMVVVGVVAAIWRLRAVQQPQTPRPEPAT